MFGLVEWMEIPVFELRRLRLLHEFALRGTIAEVAAALSYSTSTVSQQLSLLEREAGVALFEPDGRRIRLTAQGRLLADYASRALDLDEAAQRALASGSRMLEPVRISAMPTAAEALVPAALSLIAERTPDLRVTMAEEPPEEGLSELTARRVDVVIAEQYPGHTRPRAEGTDHALIGEDPIRLVIPDADGVRALGDLRDRAWVMEPRGTAAREWAVQQCRAAGFEPDVRYEAADLTVHVRLVAAGHAVGMLPDLIWSARPEGVALADLPGSPVREVFTATRTAAQGSAGIRIVRDALAEAFASHRDQSTAFADALAAR